MAGERRRNWVEKVVDFLTIVFMILPVLLFMAVLVPMTMLQQAVRTQRDEPKDDVLEEGSKILRRFCKERDGPT